VNTDHRAYHLRLCCCCGRTASAHHIRYLLLLGHGAMAARTTTSGGGTGTRRNCRPWHHPHTTNKVQRGAAQKGGAGSESFTMVVWSAGAVRVRKPQTFRSVSLFVCRSDRLVFGAIIGCRCRYTSLFRTSAVMVTSKMPRKKQRSCRTYIVVCFEFIQLSH